MTFIENRFNNFTHFVLTQYNNFDNKFLKKNPITEPRNYTKTLSKGAPLFEIFYGCIFGKLDSITRINFIVINMQCLQYVFYSLLPIQKHRVRMKDIKTIFRPKNYTAPGPRAPVLKFLDPPLYVSLPLLSSLAECRL